MSNNNNNTEWFAPVVSIASAIALVVAVCLIVLYPIFKSIIADGRVTYCFVETASYTNPTAPNVVIYNLWGFREWRNDRVLAQNLKSMDEVRESALKYGCELH